MITETGRVVALAGDKAWVQTIRASACESCSARSGCGQRVLATASGGRANQVLVANTLDVQVGDEVTVAIEEAALLSASLLVYALPLMFLVLGAVTGQHLAPGQDVGAIIGAVFGMGLGFGAARLGHSGKPGRFDPRLTSVSPAIREVVK